MPERDDDGRYAIYFVPPADAGLFRSAARWLGRNVETGAAEPYPAVGDLARHEIATITASPARYGFHATLKPPFALADGANECSFVDAVRRFCAERKTFDLPPLKVDVLGGFIALVLGRPCPEMNDLAADCVRELDSFRAPETPQEMNGRRLSGLSERQEELLALWGYPYVMEEFRFHMTLTGRLQVPGPVREALEAFFSPLLAETLTVDGIAICRQPRRDLPFRILKRIPFGH